MHPKTSTKFDIALRCTLWVIVCIFTGVSLTDVVLASGRKRVKARAVAPASIIPPPPKAGCTATSSQMTIYAADTPTYDAFVLQSKVVCQAGVNQDSTCPYFVDWTTYYRWGGIWWFSWSDTQVYNDTCGQRDDRTFYVQVGPGTYLIEARTYAGFPDNGTTALLGSTSGSYTFQ